MVSAVQTRTCFITSHFSLRKSDYFRNRASANKTGKAAMALPGEAARLQHQAAAMGVYYTCYYAGNGMLPTLSGYARDLWGSAAAPLWFAVAVLVLASSFLLLFEATRLRFAKADTANAIGRERNPC